ncbi:MAG: hypothetical protein GY862_34500 [Gammaproteobacteria bacterium]|nr:hypothetical protein [Gammaproteobacteria bacterium]
MNNRNNRYLWLVPLGFILLLFVFPLRGGHITKDSMTDRTARGIAPLASDLETLARRLAARAGKTLDNADLFNGKSRECGWEWNLKYYGEARLIAFELGLLEWLLEPATGKTSARYDRLYQLTGDSLRTQAQHNDQALPAWFPPDDAGYPPANWDSLVLVSYSGEDGESIQLSVAPPSHLRDYRKRLKENMAGILHYLLTSCLELSDSHLRGLAVLAMPGMAAENAAALIVSTARAWDKRPDRMTLIFLGRLLAMANRENLANVPAALAPGLRERLVNALAVAGGYKEKFPANLLIEGNWFLKHAQVVVMGMDAAAIRQEARELGYGGDLTRPPDVSLEQYDIKRIVFLSVAAKILAQQGEDTDAANIIRRLLLWERTIEGGNGLALRASVPKGPYPGWLGLAYPYQELTALLSAQNGLLQGEQFDTVFYLSRDYQASGLGERALWALFKSVVAP